MARKLKIITDYWLKPILNRNMDWQATTDDYEEGCPIGHGATEIEVVAD